MVSPALQWMLAPYLAKLLQQLQPSLFQSSDQFLSVVGDPDADVHILAVGDDVTLPEPACSGQMMLVRKCFFHSAAPLYHTLLKNALNAFHSCIF